MVIVALKVYGEDSNSRWFGSSAVPSTQDLKDLFFFLLLILGLNEQKLLLFRLWPLANSANASALSFCWISRQETET